MATSSEITAHQKIGLVVFIIVGIATFYLGARQLGTVLTAPFAPPENLPQYKTLAELADEREAALKTQDSDNDGVTDFDEINIFRTSAFLADSDSDGIPDGQEIAQSTDPTCPKGRTCREASIDDGTPPPSFTGGGGAPVGDSGQAIQPPTEEEIVLAMTETFGDVKSLTPEGIRDELSRMSSDDLRSFLVKIGIPPNALQQTDDASLRALVQSTMEEIAIASQTTP